MVFVSLGCTVTVQETSALKQSTPRTSLAPQKGARRSLDVCAHVLATHVTSSDGNAGSLPTPPSPSVRIDAVPHTQWPPAWTKTLQTKFSAFWDKWQKLSLQISQYKALRPDWVAQTQGLLDQHFQRFLNPVGASTATSAGPASSRSPVTAAAVAAGVSDLASASRPLTLTPYLTVADEVEVSFAAMLSDLCNMAYDVEQIDQELLQARHHLSLIATSLTCSASCTASPVATGFDSDTERGPAALAFDSGSEAEAPQTAQQPLQPQTQTQPSKGAKARHSHYNHRHHHHHGEQNPNSEAAAGGPGMVSFSMGDSPSLSPSISMLQLTSPEALTAALTSQGHGAAFVHPVYVSSLHQALTSMGSFDDDGDILDLELRAAVRAAAAVGEAGGGPSTLLVGGAGAGASSAAAAGAGGVTSMGTMGTLDEISLALLHGGGLQPLPPLPPQSVGGAADDGGSAAAAGAANGSARSLDAGSAAAPAKAATLFSDVQLSEERDFVSGVVYGYNTKLVERRRSSGGAVADANATVAAAGSAVTQSGAAGGRALREEQERSGRRRRSSSGGGATASASTSRVSVVGNSSLSMMSATMMDVGNVETDAAAAVGLLEGRVDGGVLPVAGGPPVVVACAKPPPNAWFAADDHLTKTRYFAIQGSTSLEHWQINLQFEPVVFEDPKYGVRVHRGVYEAAQILYDDLLPLVQQHLETSPYATISFAGHSLGGSLATVLMLLFVVRGVLRPSNISPVYTFGAPAVFCQGAVADAPADRCARCTLNCEMRPGGGGAGAGAGRASGGLLSGLTAAAASMDNLQTVPLGLMAGLGLNADQVVNVIMHKDLVPRAFVCDYTAVAGMLQRWMPSLRDHHSLQDDVGPHKSLYNFVGRVAVLRPSSDMPFVSGAADASHPMLPNYPALYRVGVPEDTIPSLDYAAASVVSWDELLGGSLTSAIASMSRCHRRSATSAAKRRMQLEGMQKSVMQFMNEPHPLVALSDYQAYGPQGFVSRFHNPDNYTRALQVLSGR